MIFDDNKIDCATEKINYELREVQRAISKENLTKAFGLLNHVKEAMDYFNIISPQYWQIKKQAHVIAANFYLERAIEEECWGPVGLENFLKNAIEHEKASLNPETYKNNCFMGGSLNTEDILMC